MSQDNTNRGINNAADFRKFVSGAALKALRGSMTDAEANKIAAQVALAFADALRMAKDPSALLACTEWSIAAAAARAVSTRLFPGGPAALAYLVPQRPRRDGSWELHLRPSHRGYCVLALAAGWHIQPVPVGLEDELELVDGMARLKQRTDESPERWDELRGVVVYARHLETGLVVSQWVPRAVIAKRRAMSADTRDNSVWNLWPVENAMGAAIRYAVQRGTVPVYSAELSGAIEAEDSGIIETTAETRPVSRPVAPPAAIEKDDDLLADIEAEAQRARQPERVAVEPEPASVPPMARAFVVPPSRDEIKAKIVRIETALGQDVYWPIRTRLELPLEQSVAALRHSPAVLEEYMAALQGALDAREAALDADDAT